MRRAILVTLLLASATVADAATLRERVDRTFEVRLGATLDVANVNGSITVSGWDQPRIRVIAEKVVDRTDSAEARSVMAQLKVEMSERGNSVSVRTVQPKDHAGLWDLLFGNWHDASVSYEIYVPRALEVDLETTNGALKLKEVQGTLKLETTNGRIELTRCGGAISAETTNGRIEADLLSLDAKGTNSLETTNGRIEVTVPATLHANVDAGTTNGSIESDLPIATRSMARTSLRGTVNGGGVPLKLRTTNGGIRIHASAGATR